MRSQGLKTCASMLALSTSLIFVAPTYAQDQTAAKPAAEEATGLDTIVVTASGRDKTRLKSSISVSSVTQDAISNFTPRSEAEALRTIPGLNLQDTAGPGGNSNIGVRGIPVSTGGSEYVALQEDGLPVTLFGDIQFGNNDYWIRFDNNVERLEAVRGGSASTFGSQAPGAIINYISKTGEKEGGSIGLTKAVNYNENRLDFDYGSRINDTLRFHVGGFFKDGNGPTHIGYLASRGYQIKANITKEFDDNKGYIRLNFKRLDDREPTYTTAPSLATISNGKVTGFQPFPGFDARNQSNQSIYNQNFQYLTNGGQLATANVEGIHPKVTSYGGEFQYDFNDNFSVHDNFRNTEMSGNFTTQFVNVATAASIRGTTVNGGVVGTIRYANGPNQGQIFTGTYVNNNPNINTIIRDMGSLANDLTLTGKYDLGEAKITAKAGWFHMRQTISQEWHVNQNLNELSGSNPAQLDLFTAAGAQLSAAGQSGFNNNWGNCCARSVELNYTDDAPFLSLNYSGGGLDLDGSIRFDSVKASGTAAAGVAGPNVTVRDALGSATLPSLIAASVPTEVLNYTRSYKSWSLGALYSVNDDTSVFLRVSRGGRFNADRQTLGGNFTSSGGLTQSSRLNSVNFLTQQELGVKNRGSLASGNYFVEATFFRAQLVENNYDFTRINNPPPNNNPNISNGYHSYGLEFTGGFKFDNFNLTSDITFSKSKIVSSATAALVGKTPQTLPNLTYRISPSYDAGIAAIGFTIDGQTSTWSDNFNTLKIKGQTYFNGFAKVRPFDSLELGLNVNNLFNTLGYRGNGSVFTNGTTNIFQNSAVLGRTITASINYKF